jgi:hypothetical protein
MSFLHREPEPSEAEMSKLSRRMASGEPFTYGELHAAGLDKRRAADKQIQKWRRKGWISFARFGRQALWSLTDAGRAATEDLRG